MSRQTYDTVETQVLSVFITAIEYGDYSGLETEEMPLLDNWLEEQPSGAVYEYGEESFFGECDITGWMGDVVTVKINHNFRSAS